MGGWIKRLFGNDTFERDSLQDDPFQIIGWWESRRLLFNVVVGSTGIFTFIAMLACAALAEPRVGEAIGLPNPPILAILAIPVFGIGANLCYTAGWVAELLLRKFRPQVNATQLGLSAFRVGLTFSITITLLPALLSWGVFLIALLNGQKQRPPGG